MYSGPALCRPEKCKQFCVRACPHQALLEERLSVTIGNRVFEYSVINAKRCKYQRIGGKYMRGKAEFPMNPGDEEMARIMKGFDMQRMNPRDKALQIFTMGPSCGECMVKCPSPWRQ
jgi:hypothetical protein